MTWLDRLTRDVRNARLARNTGLEAGDTGLARDTGLEAGDTGLARNTGLDGATANLGFAIGGDAECCCEGQGHYPDYSPSEPMLHRGGASH